MEKKNNNLVIILMGIIIVILSVLCVLFATDTITFNKQVPNNSNENNVEEKTEEILKNLVTNNLKQLVWNDYGNYGCETSEEEYQVEENVLEAAQISYFKCTDVKTKEEYINNIKNNLIKDGIYSTNYIEAYINAVTKWANEETHPEYKCKTDVCEYKGSVYFMPIFKPMFDADDIERQEFNNIKCSINKNESNVIEGTVILTWNSGYYTMGDPEAEMYFHEKYNISVVKENNIWKIDKFESLEVEGFDNNQTVEK